MAAFWLLYTAYSVDVIALRHAVPHDAWRTPAAVARGVKCYVLMLDRSD